MPLLLYTLVYHCIVGIVVHMYLAFTVLLVVCKQKNVVAFNWIVSFHCLPIEGLLLKVVLLAEYTTYIFKCLHQHLHMVR